MKKIKLLTPILTTACVATTIVPIVSCSKIEHVTLSSLEEGTQVGTKNGKYFYAKYNLSLDNDTYKNGDITCKVVSDNADLFKINPTINGYSLTLDVQYWKLEVGNIKFTVQFSNGSWTQDIDLIMNIESTETTLDEYIGRYTTIRNHFLANEQDQKYNTCDLSVGDYMEINTAGQITRETIDESTEQLNVVTYESEAVSSKYDSLQYIISIKGTSWGGFGMSYGSEPKELKYYYEQSILQGAKMTFLVPDDGSLGIVTEHEYEENNKLVKSVGEKIVNSEGYIIKMYRTLEITDLTTKEIISSQTLLANLINYRKS